MNSSDIKIAFFDAKPYDIESFDEINKKYDFNIKYFKFHLTADNIILAKDYDVIVVFVNNTINAEIIGKLIKTSDLVAGLKSGKIGSAGLDVYVN